MGGATIWIKHIIFWFLIKGSSFVIMWLEFEALNVSCPLVSLAQNDVSPKLVMTWLFQWDTCNSRVSQLCSYPCWHCLFLKIEVFCAIYDVKNYCPEVVPRFLGKHAWFIIGIEERSAFLRSAVFDLFSHSFHVQLSMSLNWANNHGPSDWRVKLHIYARKWQTPPPQKKTLLTIY